MKTIGLLLIGAYIVRPVLEAIKPLAGEMDSILGDFGTAVKNEFKSYFEKTEQS